MASTIAMLTERNIISPPDFLPSNMQYETIMGSVAYGVSSDTSDMDIYGFCIPPKRFIFPHTAGHIHNFGSPPPKFDQYQKHHVFWQDAKRGRGRTYDFSIYNIVKYFQLCMDNNPNMIDSLFTPLDCVLHSTPIAEMVRERRTLFLHKGCWPKFKGYAYSQLHKMKNKQPIGKRVATVKEFGFDVKFAYHLVRLLDEVEQILMTGNIDLRRNREELKAIRRGEWTEDRVIAHFAAKEAYLSELFVKSDLRPEPAEPEIKQLLIDCLEHHYGRLGDALIQPDRYQIAVAKIQSIITEL